MIIREAIITDAFGIAKVHVDSWRTTYKNIVPDIYLNNLSYERREQLWNDNISKDKVFVAENEHGKIVGFATGGKERNEKFTNFHGELTSIYILKE